MIGKSWLRFTLAGVLGASCAGPQHSGSRHESADGSHKTPDSVNIALARQRSHKPRFTWQDFSPQVFAQAKAEGKLVLLDCVAVWCHWCHVMDETTYADPEIGELLRTRFITMRGDVDARPELTARYEEWGWPATVIFNPAGEELGKFRGYLAPDELRTALNNALAAQAAAQSDKSEEKTSGPYTAGPSFDMMNWIGARVARDLDDRYDDEEGGWGSRQKLPLGANLEFELVRASHGDSAALSRARFTFDKQRAILDPVWGGMYQYSTDSVWTNPHFEKRLPIQTATLEALARAYGLTREKKYLDDALRIEGYLRQFLQDADGAFLVSQDADLGGFEGHGKFVDGHDYFVLDDAHRRALGIPRIDRNVYPYENGLGIAALVSLAAVVEPPLQDELMTRARRAADLMLARFVDAGGTVWRNKTPVGSARYLADAAAMGRALSLLAARTKDPRYVLVARQVAGAMLRMFSVAPNEVIAGTPPSDKWLLWVHTPDAAAVGIFARREKPFAHNVLAARFLLSLGDAAEKQRARRFCWRCLCLQRLTRKAACSANICWRSTSRGRCAGSRTSAYCLTSDSPAVVGRPVQRPVAVIGRVPNFSVLASVSCARSNSFMQEDTDGTNGSQPFWLMSLRVPTAHMLLPPQLIMFSSVRAMSTYGVAPRSAMVKSISLAPCTALMSLPVLKVPLTSMRSRRRNDVQF